jgi:hypothetical protein
MRVPAAALVVSAGMFLIAGPASAADIRGTISTTLTITDNSQLVGDVTCTVSGAPCITFGASGISLKLNGFTITGQGDPATGCAGTAVGTEQGLIVNGIRGAVIQGPGVIQRFRGDGIFITGASSRVLVTKVTTSTNCLSGIRINASNDNDFEENNSIRNGNTGAPCGGI